MVDRAIGQVWFIFYSYTSILSFPGFECRWRHFFDARSPAPCIVLCLLSVAIYCSYCLAGNHRLGTPAAPIRAYRYASSHPVYKPCLHPAGAFYWTWVGISVQVIGVTSAARRLPLVCHPCSMGTRLHTRLQIGCSQFHPVIRQRLVAPTATMHAQCDEYRQQSLPECY